MITKATDGGIMIVAITRPTRRPEVRLPVRAETGLTDARRAGFGDPAWNRLCFKDQRIWVLREGLPAKSG
jgi:hypothetical protein